MAAAGLEPLTSLFKGCHANHYSIMVRWATILLSIVSEALWKEKSWVVHKANIMQIYFLGRHHRWISAPTSNSNFIKINFTSSKTFQMNHEVEESIPRQPKNELSHSTSEVRIPCQKTMYRVPCSMFRIVYACFSFSFSSFLLIWLFI